MSSSMMDVDNDEASRAYAAISEQLQSWTSPQGVGAHASTSASYTQDSVQWMKTFAQDNDSTLTPQKRPSGEATPVMSNSAKKPHSPYVHIMDTDDDAPWIDRTLPTRSTTPSHEFRRYHDVLYSYLVARRSLAERLRLNQKEAALVAKDAASVVDVALAQEERSMELEYLSSLASMEDSLENNVWSLLVALRFLGLEALLWKPWGHAEDISDYVNRLASRKDATPGQLIHDLYYLSVSPLILQRRKQVLEWIQRCHAEHLGDLELPRKQTVMWPDSLERLQHGARDPTKVMCMDPDAPLLVQDSTSPFYGKDGENQERLLKACLAYILAGHLQEAMTLCQKQGQPWLSASLGGGQPFDVELVPDTETQQVIAIQTGNPRRALWKRTCWALARASNVSPQESAIYALLSNDVWTALKNPCLRTWEGGMYACWSSMLGRLEDDLLHRHNRSSMRIPQEEQLQSTALIASWNESTILDQLASSPFEDMHPSDVFRGAMASFLVGKDAVLNFLIQEGTESQDLHLLRFMAHLLLYLDSLSVGMTPVDLPGIQAVKNRFVLEYLEQLGMRPELWHMMALYASLLPEVIMMKEYPPILCNVQDDDERSSMCKQMRELLPSGMDLAVLRRVVRLLLTERDPHTPMRSISWLCHSESHLADALVCTTMLLRKYFLAEDDQLPRALVFLDQYLPPPVTEYAKSNSAQENNQFMDALTTENSKLEFGGLQCYLEAYKAFRHWKEVMASTPPITVTSKIVHNRAALNQTELEIANSAEQRELVNQKRRASRKVVEAADAAQSKLMEVLTFGGGWLMQEDSIHDESDEAKQRRGELDVIQSRYLPRAVFMFHSVCDKTAAWMADSLDDAVSILGKMALSTLDNASEDSASPLSPLYWIRRAMALVETVSSEENCIFNTFSEDDGENFASMITESKVRELLYETTYS